MCYGSSCLTPLAVETREGGWPYSYRWTEALSIGTWGTGPPTPVTRSADWRREGDSWETPLFPAQRALNTLVPTVATLQCWIGGVVEHCECLAILRMVATTGLRIVRRGHGSPHVDQQHGQWEYRQIECLPGLRHRSVVVVTVSAGVVDGS